MTYGRCANPELMAEIVRALSTERLWILSQGEQVSFTPTTIRKCPTDFTTRVGKLVGNLIRPQGLALLPELLPVRQPGYPRTP